jgi:hypothetical protein
MRMLQTALRTSVAPRSCICPMSPPAENASPVPVRIRHRISGSPSKPGNSSARPERSAKLMAFILAGLLRRNRAVAPLRSTMTADIGFSLGALPGMLPRSVRMAKVDFILRAKKPS